MLVAALLAVVLLLAAGCGSKDRPPSTSTPASASTTPAKECKGLADLQTGQSLVATAVAEGPLSIYANPGDATPTSTLANPRLINNDPNAHKMLVSVKVTLQDGKSYRFDGASPDHDKKP